MRSAGEMAGITTLNFQVPHHWLWLRNEYSRIRIFCTNLACMMIYTEEKTKFRKNTGMDIILTKFALTVKSMAIFSSFKSTQSNKNVNDQLLPLKLLLTAEISVVMWKILPECDFFHRNSCQNTAVSQDATEQIAANKSKQIYHNKIWIVLLYYHSL